MQKGISSNRSILLTVIVAVVVSGGVLFLLQFGNNEDQVVDEIVEGVAVENVPIEDVTEEMAIVEESTNQPNPKIPDTPTSPESHPKTPNPTPATIPAPAIVEQEPVKEMAFDGCGNFDKYKGKSWFTDLIMQYEAMGQTMDDVETSKGDACLSLDESLFIFMPADSAHGYGCGKIFSYNIANKLLQTPPESYCAFEFGKRVGDYVKFTGKEEEPLFDNIPCMNHVGEFYFKENRIKVSKSAC
jgi:hypothetical protein